MQRLFPLRALTRLATRRSFSLAARDLGVAQSTVSKAIGQLEKELAVRLVQRNARSVTLTQAGALYAEKCQEILFRLDELTDQVRSSRLDINGSIRISMPVPFGVYWLTPRLVRFQKQHPSIRLQCDFNDEAVNLLDEGYDLAIRAGDLRSDRVVARKLGHSQLVLVASAAYLKRRGHPKRTSDLAQHDCLLYSMGKHPHTWSFEKTHKGGSGTSGIDVSGPLVSNNFLALKQACLLDLGIARLPEWLVEAELQNQQLTQVLVDENPGRLPLHAILPSVRNLPLRIRALLDFLQGEFSQFRVPNTKYTIDQRAGH